MDELPHQQLRAEAAFIENLLNSAASVRVPELFTPPTGEPIYYQCRNGLAIIVLRTPDLSDDQLTKLARFWFAQYVLTDYLDPVGIYAAQVEYESLDHISPHDLHFVAGVPDSGEIVCYGTVAAAGNVPLEVTLRTPDRPLLPVEKVFGHGIFNRLSILPDLPLARIREMSRFVKDQRRHPLDQLGVRAPIEILVALVHVLRESMGGEIDACVAYVEEDVAKRNLDFFYLPTVLLHGGMPYVPQDSYWFPAFQHHNRYPLAFLCADLNLAAERLTAIDHALSLPGRSGIAALLALKRDIRVPKSRLEPLAGAPALTTTAMPQRDVNMHTRGQLIGLGNWLRRTAFLNSLSTAEATVMGTFMERLEVSPGEVIIRQGDIGDAMYLIETGRAEVQFHDASGHATTVAIRGVGEYIGEIALIVDTRRTADVIAQTSMCLLKLTREDYIRYLAQLEEVEQQVQTTAQSRLGELSSLAAAGHDQHASAHTGSDQDA